MANQLRESAEFVVFLNPSLHNLNDAGLMVVNHSNPYYNIIDAGLMVVHDASAPDPQASLAKSGLFICFFAESNPQNQQFLQAFSLINFTSLQQNFKFV